MVSALDPPLDEESLDPLLHDDEDCELPWALSLGEEAISELERESGESGLTAVWACGRWPVYSDVAEGA